MKPTSNHYSISISILTIMFCPDLSLPGLPDSIEGLQRQLLATRNVPNVNATHRIRTQDLARACAKVALG